ncbi:MAG TPA: TVP38/TMEM64 family protein, partial [Salinimicrobium sp.]|nr:TVP38/TMEM64 family protein [Salinimicrobium sp.]
MSEDFIEDSTVKQSKAPLYISIGVVITVVLAYFFIPSVHDFLQNAWSVLTSGDEQRINNWVDQFGFWGPLI